MLPWLIVESITSIYSTCFGLASALMAAQWARQYADFATLMSYYVDFYQVALTDERLRTQFTAQGIFLIAKSLASVYLVVAVCRYYPEMKNSNAISGGAERRSRPMLRLQEVPSIAEELNKPSQRRGKTANGTAAHVRDIEQV